jgi:outer membrane biosynthesis protein TonB
MKKSRKGKSTVAVLIGSKQQVWEGKADITGGKLKKCDLMMCAKTKRIISKKKHDSGLALMERARKAKEDPEDPLHSRFVSFFEHQYKKKETDEANPVQKDLPIKEKKPRKKREKKVKVVAEEVQPELDEEIVVAEANAPEVQELNLQFIPLNYI